VHWRIVPAKNPFNAMALITLAKNPFNAMASERFEEATTSWLPALVTRPVLPLEEFTFGAAHPHAKAALQLCQSRGLPLAALAAMPEPEDGKAEWFGTSLHIEDVSELADGSLQVRAIGMQPFRVVAERVQPHRLESGTAAMSKMVRIMAVSCEDNIGIHSDIATDASCKHIHNLLRALRPIEASSWGKPPADATSFSWWATARLPLPATARGLLLRVESTKERLDICAEVLAAAGRVASQPVEVEYEPELFRSRL